MRPIVRMASGMFIFCVALYLLVKEEFLSGVIDLIIAAADSISFLLNLSGADTKGF